MKTLKEFVLEGNIFVVAHRGSSGTHPENTMAAFREAVDAGAMMIETDIQFTSDNRIIAFHDSELTNKSDGSGNTVEMPYESIKDLDVGSWFDKKYSGERIPLLSALIDEIKGKVYLNIEIKNRTNRPLGKRLEHLLGMIHDKEIENHVLFSSFDHKLLGEIKKIAPEIPLAVINLPGDNRLPSEIAGTVGAGAFVCSIKEINDERMNDALSNGLYIGIYSIDDPKNLYLVEKYKLQAVVSNYPRKIMTELRNMKLIDSKE